MGDMSRFYFQSDYRRRGIIARFGTNDTEADRNKILLNERDNIIIHSVIVLIVLTGFAIWIVSPIISVSRQEIYIDRDTEGNSILYTKEAKDLLGPKIISRGQVKFPFTGIIISIQFILNNLILLAGVPILCTSKVTLGSSNTSCQLMLFKWWCISAVISSLLTFIEHGVIFVYCLSSKKFGAWLWPLIFHCIYDFFWCGPMLETYHLFQRLLNPNWAEVLLSQANNVNYVNSNNFEVEHSTLNPTGNNNT